MISENQLSRRREYKNMKRKQLHKWLKAIKEYPQQSAIQEQVIITQRRAIENYDKLVSSLINKLSSLESKQEKKEKGWGILKP